MLFLAGVFLGNAAMAGLQMSISEEFAYTYGMLLVYPLQFIPMMLYVHRANRRISGVTDSIPIDNNGFEGRSGWCLALTASIMMLAAAFVIEPVTMLLPEMDAQTKAIMERLLSGPTWAVFLSVSVAAPLFEEWLCRGVLLKGLIEKTGPAWAIVISSLVFGLIHGNLWQAIPAFMMGCLLGYVYYRTGSLKLTTLMHSVNNTLSLIVSRIPALDDVEFFAEIISPWAYVASLIAFAAALTGGIALFSTIRSPFSRKKD